MSASFKIFLHSNLQSKKSYYLFIFLVIINQFPPTADYYISYTDS